MGKTDESSSDTRRWCEYIAFRGLWRIGFARLHESDITDTELQVGKFLLAKPNQDVVYETNEEMYWHIGEADVCNHQRVELMARYPSLGECRVCLEGMGRGDLPSSSSGLV